MSGIYYISWYVYMNFSKIKRTKTYYHSICIQVMKTYSMLLLFMIIKLNLALKL